MVVTGGKDSQEFMAITPCSYRPWPLGGVRQVSCIILDEIPKEAQEEITSKNCSNGWFLVKTPLPTKWVKPCGQLGNQRLQTKQPCCDRRRSDTARKTPGVKSIGWSRSLLEYLWRANYQGLGLYRRRGEPVVACLAMTSLMKSNWNYLGAGLLEPATEAEVVKLLGADFGSLEPVNLPENVKIKLTARQDSS